MKIVQKIFGPVGVLIKFEDEEDVIRQVNDTLCGLTCINCINMLEPNVPFGGFEQSGSAYYPHF